MIVIPAIDLKDGKCVRLRQGRMDEDTVFSENPLDIAEQFAAQGARRLHLVDLDGAFAGQPKNAQLVTQITAALPDLPVQIGGGIRNLDTAKAYIDAGVRWVILGTVAIKQPEFVDELCAAFPEQVIVGLDANNGMVASEGWAEESNVTATSLGLRYADSGVAAIVYTDISRDGMMQGVNAVATRDLADAIDIPVIASGGVSSSKDIETLCAYSASGIQGCIVGRALYEGSLDVAAAQVLADSLTRP
ncbi:MAG: 1-(5-phosphoribosyl)-5-[(5-phosphoribosylamino)methylideneamino]imidazole-4-carboxamide isomerase [Gammaproteobacteria bacterium]|nr:1-(5-phosphoribosyl)-5-[(5-phosphoribosylamino)methylideneamino]imidazole-4-carboxamide isomerase [Gammaproteobacteria bacterium]